MPVGMRGRSRGEARAIRRRPRRRRARAAAPAMAVAVGHGEDRPVVGRACSPSPRARRVGGRAQALEPRGRHDGVGVDDHHVGRRGVAERRVDVARRSRGSPPAAVLDVGNSRRSGERLDLAVAAASSATSTRVPAVVCVDDAAQALLEEPARPEHGRPRPPRQPRPAGQSSSRKAGPSGRGWRKPSKHTSNVIPNGISRRSAPPMAWAALGAVGSTIAFRACWTITASGLHMIRCAGTRSGSSRSDRGSTPHRRTSGAPPPQIGAT